MEDQNLTRRIRDRFVSIPLGLTAALLSLWVAAWMQGLVFGGIWRPVAGAALGSTLVFLGHRFLRQHLISRETQCLLAGVVLAFLWIVVFIALNAWLVIGVAGRSHAEVVLELREYAIHLFGWTVALAVFAYTDYDNLRKRSLKRTTGGQGHGLLGSA